MANSATIGQLEITRYVQSTVKVKTPQRIIWIDPIMVTAEHVGNDKADLILVTHEHGDHFNIDALNRVAKVGSVLVCPNSGIAGKIQGQVNAQLCVLKEGDTLETGGLRIKAVAGYNNFHPRNQGYNSFNVGFVFALGGQQVFHAGDTGLVEEFRQVGPLDISLLPIGGTYTMDEAEAAKAATEYMKPKVAIPMHYGFATGGDPNKFKQLIGRAAQVHVLDPVIPARAR